MWVLPSRVEIQILPTEVVHVPDSGAEQGPTTTQLLNQVSFLEAEVADLRRRLADTPGSARALDQRLLDTQRSLAAITSQNERLATTLREARPPIVTLKEEADPLP